MAEVFGVAASAIALIELFAKIGVLCSIYCAGVKAAPQDIRNILNEADRCTASLRAVERLVTRPNGIKDENARNLHRNLETCRTLLDELAVKLEKGTKLGRLQWPLDKKSVTNVVKKLEQCRSAISLDLQVSQTDLLLDANQESVLAKLRTVNGASYDAYNDAESSTCLPNTRVEILQQIQEWGASTDEECIFWLNGMAGTGKSTISRTVAQTFAKKKMLGASFFFKRGEGDRGHAGLFIPTIAAQLVQKTPDLAEPVYQQMYYEPAVSDKSINIQFETLIQRPFQELPQRADPPILVVVVDALDECDRLDHVKLITHLLSQAKTLQSVRLKFFMTSRPELPITLGFQTLDTKYKEFILHEVPEPIIKNDIDLFLEIQLSKIKQDYNKSVTLSRQLPPDWPGDRHQKRLVELATPLFIFAATVCRFIQDRRFGSPQRLLARFLENQADVGSKLQATYRPVLDQLLLGLDDSEKEEVAARFREIVGSIVALADPLTTHSLSALLEIPQDMIEDQLDLLHSVLQVPATQEDPVRLLHLSFRDYLFNLDKANKSSDSLFSISETRTHERMAGKCLKLLSRRLKRDICDLGQQDFPRADIEGRTLDAKVAPEVQYACRYWVEHWRLSGRKIQDEDITHDFFRRHLLHWLEALTLLGLLREGISLVDKLSALLKPNESVVVSSLLSDTRRFILSNLSTVDEFPLQLYYSAIIFAPTSSLVRQTFKQEFPVWLPEPPTTEANWGPFVQSLNTVSSAIWVVAISPDSKLLAIGTNEDTVEIWDPGVGLCMATLYGHDGLVMSVAFSSDSALLATTSDDFVMIWDLEVYECIASLEGHTDAVTDVAFQPNSRKLASASYDNTIRIWDLSTNTCTGILKGHLDVVQKLTFSHDARLIASASSDSTLKLWDVATGKCRATLEGHTESVESVTFSPDSTLVASSSDDESIKIWNIATATCVATLEGHDDSVESVAFSPRSSTLASASLDGTVKLWDVSTGECFSTFEGHTNGVQSVAFSPDGRILASASRDATVRLWDTEVKPMTNKLNHGSRVKTFKLSGDGKFLVSITNDDSVSLYNVISSSTDPILEGFHDATMKAVFSPDSRMLLTASKDHAIKLWDLGADVSLRATYSSELNFQWGIHISGDSSMIALVSRQSAVKLLDTVTGEIIKTVDSAETEDTKTVLSQDFGLVALASDRNDLRLSDIDRTREDVLMSSHSEEQESLALAFSPDSSTLASATSGAIKLWNTSSRACVATIPIHNIAFGLAFSADASSLHTGFGTIMLNGDLSPRICPVHLGGLSKDEAPTFVETHGLGFGQWNDWITWGTRNLVRVPLEQRYLTCIIRGSTLVMKTTSGRLLIMKASADDDLYA